MEEGNAVNQNVSQLETGLTGQPAEVNKDLLTKFKENPSLIPKKWEGSAEAFIESYYNLQKFATQASQERAALKQQLEASTTDDTTDTSEEEIQIDSLSVNPDAENTDSTEEDTTGSGVDWNKVMEEFGQNKGALTKETRAAILKTGIPEILLDSALAGQAALWEKQVAEAASAVGGKQNLQRLLDHVQQNFSPEQIDEFNASMINIKTAKYVLKGLYEEVFGTTAGAVKPSGGNQSLTGAIPNAAVAIAPFPTMADMLHAQQDRRYGTDPQYTREVQQRVLKTYQQTG